VVSRRDETDLRAPQSTAGDTTQAKPALPLSTDAPSGVAPLVPAGSGKQTVDGRPTPPAPLLPTPGSPIGKLEQLLIALTGDSGPPVMVTAILAIEAGIATGLGGMRFRPDFFGAVTEATFAMSWLVRSCLYAIGVAASVAAGVNADRLGRSPRVL